jgi:hypothetical protein
MTQKDLMRPALITAAILLVPLWGDLYGGWAWRWPGFVVFGALLFGIVLAFEQAGRHLKGVVVGLGVGLGADMVLLAVLHHGHPGDDIAGFAMLSFFVSGFLSSWAGWLIASAWRGRKTT